MLIKGKYRTFLLLLACCLLLFLSGCSLIPKEEDSLAPPLVKPTKPNLQTAEAEIGTVAMEVNGVASFEPVHMEYYRLKGDGGKVKKIYVQQGDIVKKGTPLIDLDLENGDLDLKYKELAYQKTLMAMDQAKQSQDKDQMKISLLELQIAEIELDKAREKLKNKQLIAGMDGKVIFIEDIKAGDMAKNDLELVGVADMSQMRLAYAGDEKSIRDVVVGMKAVVKYGSEKMEGTIVQTPSSAPPVNNQELEEKYSRTLYINLPKLPKGVTFGDMADVTITTEKKDNVVKIPKRGLRSYMGTDSVQVLEGESVKQVNVEVGIETGTEVEIIKGLKAGQKIILQ